MRPDVLLELKSLRLYGMVGAWGELVEQHHPLDAERWLIEHLVQAEHADRAARSVRNQLTLARFPLHRDLAGFEFEGTPVDRALIQRLADASFNPRLQPWFEARIKLAETSKLHVLVQANGQLYSSSKTVRVIVGGCLPG